MMDHDRRGARSACALAWLAFSVALPACSDLAEFETADGEVFRGDITGGDESGRSSSFIGRGFPGDTQLELEFHPQAVYRDPGRLRLGWADGVESTAALAPLPPLAHDLLSKYDFPGEGRLRNYIFGATLFADLPDGSAGDGFAARPRDVMVFVSLMADGSVEVRLMSPKADLFGVFAPLRRERVR